MDVGEGRLMYWTLILSIEGAALVSHGGKRAESKDKAFDLVISPVVMRCGS